MNLYTKNGRPLQVQGDVVYSRSGKLVGKIANDRVFGPNGSYVGTIDGGRLIYRSTESAARGYSFTTANVAGSAMGSVAGVASWGDEPDIPD
ncbi:hypothetical protein RA27_01575 [Ruegeria sp. ANG-R]|uniref:4-fold beta flower protein n=1 Tax=Ruegeria sp. ANG-R TaxID=1577903 RepID=UPI00057FC8FC|nr:hypothetical protein [Ruegeria sp. ANG-R]KIC42121.1 hypothetical protein RA27_01575 [Ruegeria sp. ANG-R]